MPQITSAEFGTRFAALVLSSNGSLPKKPFDRHILYLSAALGIEPQRSYTESELNDVLQDWTARFGERWGLDHAVLRRALVDEGYLRRDSAGRSYELVTVDAPYTLERPDAPIDLDALVEQAREEREKRKSQFAGKKG